MLRTPTATATPTPMPRLLPTPAMATDCIPDPDCIVCLSLQIETARDKRVNSQSQDLLFLITDSLTQSECLVVRM